MLHVTRGWLWEQRSRSGCASVVSNCGLGVEAAADLGFFDTRSESFRRKCERGDPVRRQSDPPDPLEEAEKLIGLPRPRIRTDGYETRRSDSGGFGRSVWKTTAGAGHSVRIYSKSIHRSRFCPSPANCAPSRPFALPAEPSKKNGLRAPSQIMVDKAHTIPRDKADALRRIGTAELLTPVDQALAVFSGVG